MTLETVVLLLTLGLIGGVWNAVAGGATLFTFPALMAAGLPPTVANATNYLALLPSNAAALPAYWSELKSVGPIVWRMLVVSGLGAVVGALLLVVSDPAVFTDLIPILILMATGLFAFSDGIAARTGALAGGTANRALLYPALFVVSIYGGYFGAGLSIVLLAIVQVMGYRAFHVANSIKNLLATSFTLLSIFIFGIGGLIAWPEALAMIGGSTLGGYMGGRFAKRIDVRYLKTAIITFGLVLSAVYFAKTFST